MNLHQWFTNLPALTTIIEKMRTGSERDHVGRLGVTWNRKEDTLRFPPKAIVIPPNVRFTKRLVVGSASSKFDPINLISLVLVPAKKFIPSLWNKGFDWNEVLPDKLQQQCNLIAKFIEAASAFVTSRHLYSTSRNACILWCMPHHCKRLPCLVCSEWESGIHWIQVQTFHI